MKLIESKAEYIPQEEGLEGIYKQIELAGRTAYHSQDKITPDSAKDFVDRMIKSRHGAALEAGTVYLIGRFSSKKELFEDEWAFKYIENPYTKTIRIPLDENNCYNDPQLLYVTTNYRVLVENGWLNDLKEPEDTNTVISYNPSIFHEKRYTMRFITDIGVCRELLRHRMFSFLNESTRYCNYNREKFGKEVTFITPSWYHYDPNEAWEDVKNAYFREICEQTEAAYLNSIKNGATPQEARQVLPLATKTELIMTGFSSDWRFLMDLRLFGKTGAPHPDMLSLMQKTQKTMQETGIWEDIMSKPSKFE